MKKVVSSIIVVILLFVFLYLTEWFSGLFGRNMMYLVQFIIFSFWGIMFGFTLLLSKRGRWKFSPKILMFISFPVLVVIFIIWGIPTLQFSALRLFATLEPPPLIAIIREHENILCILSLIFGFSITRSICRE